MKSPQSPHSSSLWVFALSLRVLFELSPSAPISHLGTTLFSTVLVCLALGSSQRETSLSWPGGQATSHSYGNVLSKFSIIYCLFYYQLFQRQHQPSGCQPPQYQNSGNRPHPSCINTNTIPTVLTRHRQSMPAPPLVLPDQVTLPENIHVLHHLVMKQTLYEMPNHTYSEVRPCIYLDVPIP